jgi:hypothetical protein
MWTGHWDQGTCPPRSTDRIAQRRRLNQTFEIVEQGRVTLGQPSGAATLTANSAERKWPRIQVFQSALDGAVRQPRDPGHRCKTSPSGSPSLARSEQSSTAFVALRAVCFPPLPNRLSIDHACAGSA